MARSIHFHTTKGWMNDPNGFIYYKGEYHLFYQYFPYATQWGTICWGHATSKDLVNWDQQEIALFPSLPEDQNGCFSGSAVEMGGQLRLFYTGVHYEEVDPTNINKCIPRPLHLGPAHRELARRPLLRQLRRQDRDHPAPGRPGPGR